MQSLQRKKAERFINAMTNGMDDPIIETVLRIAYLGDSEEKLEEVLEKQRKQMEEYASHCELTDVSKTIMTDEEKQALISQNIITNGENNTELSPDKRPDNISSEHTTDNGSCS